jgi:dipeptidyl aminopeptidase/acylaminoacyl peptidase
MVTKQRPPAPGALERQFERQRRTLRNRRFTAIGLAAAVVVGLGVFALLRAPEDSAPPLSSKTPSPSLSVPPATLPLDEQDVAVVGLDGSAVVGIPGIPEDAYALDLSRDGQRVVFVTNEDGVDQLATIGVDGTRMEVLPTSFSVSQPAWSDDGNWIAFVGFVDAQADVYVIAADGTNLRALTTDSADDLFPRFSPDGSTVAYMNVGNRPAPDAQFSETAEVWTVPAAGGTPERLTKADGYDAYPDYSPDGTRIVFGRSDGLYVMDADGTNAHRILQGGWFTPRWSPDGRRIAYTTFDDSYRPSVPMGSSFAGSAPLVVVNVVDVRTGSHHRVGDAAMATDINVPVWWSADELLIRRVGH